MKNKTVITKDIYLECNDIVFKYYYNTLLIIYEVLLAIFVIVLFALKDYIFALIFFGVLIAVPFLLNKFLKDGKKYNSIYILNNINYYLNLKNKNNLKIFSNFIQIIEPLFYIEKIVSMGQLTQFILFLPKKKNTYNFKYYH